MGMIGRAAADGEGLMYVFKRAGDPDLVNTAMKEVHTQSKLAEKSLKLAEKSLKSGTLSDAELLKILPPLADSIMAALDAASTRLGSTYFRDQIHDGDTEDDPDIIQRDAEEVDEMFTSEKAAFVQSLLLNAKQLKVACNPYYIRV